MQHVKNGDIVQIHFTGRFLDGRVFGTSNGKTAVELRVGDPEVVPGLQRALLGMHPGESKTVLVPVDEAFGVRKNEFVFRLDAAKIPAEAWPKVGETLELQNDAGARMTAQVVEVSREEITLDANHPLAGHDLAFDIELLRIGPSTASN